MCLHTCCNCQIAAPHQICLMAQARYFTCWDFMWLLKIISKCACYAQQFLHAQLEFSFLCGICADFKFILILAGGPLFVQQLKNLTKYLALYYCSECDFRLCYHYTQFQIKKHCNCQASFATLCSNRFVGSLLSYACQKWVNLIATIRVG